MEPIEEVKKKKWLTFKLWDRAKDIKWLQKIVLAIMVVIFFVLVKDDESTNKIASVLSNNTDSEESECNVYGINLRGELVTYTLPENFDEELNHLTDETSSEEITIAIQEYNKVDSVKAIILEIDSYGGYPVAGEEVANALKNAKKPTVVLIRSAANSAAYMAASGADRIFASKNSDVGGIGVTMSYLDNSKQNNQEGLTFVPLSAGRFKDVGNPGRPLSQEEKNLLMRDVNIMHKNFIKLVAENRKLDIEKVSKLADGSSMLGEMALENGLIDEVGGMREVEEYLKGVVKGGVEVCW